MLTTEPIKTSTPEPKGATATNDTVDPNFRKRKLVRKQGGTSKIKFYVWLTGHVFSVVFGAISFVFQILWLKNIYYINSISYRLSLLGTVLALGATMSKKFGLHFLPPLPTLLAQLNFQQLMLAVIWCFTFKSVFKIIPTFLVSVLQLGAYFKIAPVQNASHFLGAVIALDEILLVGYLLLRTLFFRNTAGYQLLIVLVGFWLRVLFDEDTANLVAFLVDKLDGKVSTMKNPKVLKIWGKVKLFLKEKQNPGMFSS